ncbi:ShlB/FhaC/HecB family hemolysin secretion/activation protein [Ramlibacter tataouinensis]|uniref:ShlB/FhaC/HecB family hemolysin secretion/activation protein n=1 Tax=Ramlibacter tataouinensis TaxID=94132 RepID=UPI0022F3D72D|nr:ShlB/FhaC/HecB family hemolysin secretion/activation protein [Ramlibacter tataouinensis]WBY02170.1 ShlB/FhaC/HecB family hemolysin secretion/activation protein [Ramlibacter tataouinensis]
MRTLQHEPCSGGHRRETSRLPLGLAFLVLAGGALAQPVQIPPGSDPAVIQQREIERERRMRADELRRDRIEQPVRPTAPAEPAPAGADSMPFEVREIRVEPRSELLDAGAIDALVAGYRGRSLRLSDLRELTARINELYRAKGIVTAQAVLPPQDVTDGTVRIRLVEGRVGQVRIQGNESTNEDYIRDRLTLKPPMLVDMGELEQDLVRFNRSNDAQLRADLRPGSELGQTDIQLQVQEPKRNELRLFVDNSGSTLTGEGRVGVAYMRRSLTGRRDDIYLSAVRSEGHEGNYLSYGVPVTRLGTRLTLGYFKDRTRVVNGPIAPLDVTGSAESISLSLRHPLRVQSRFQLDALASFKQRRTANWIVGTPLTASELSGGTVGLDLQVLGDNGYWTGTAELGSGIDRPDGAPARHYTLLRGTLRRSLTWSPDLTLVGSLSWQYAPLKLLPSSEQIVIGGEGSVRGHSLGLFSGDRGYVLNLEAHYRLALPPSSAAAGSAFVFLDHGVVRPFRPQLNPRGSDALTAVGAGVNLTFGSTASARVTLSLPVGAPPEEPRNYRINAQLIWHLL